jgi:hypothetical protein
MFAIAVPGRDQRSACCRARRRSPISGLKPRNHEFDIARVFRFVTAVFARISKSSLRMCGEWRGAHTVAAAAHARRCDRR